MTPPDTPKSRRRWWRIAAWFMGSMFTLLLLTLAGGAWWLYGWQWHGGMSFHESWTAEERAALTQFERYLHTQLADDMGLVYDAMEDTMEELVNEMSAEEEENDDETTDEWTDESNATPKEPLGLTTRLTMAVLMKLQIAPIDAALHEVAATGKGDPTELVSTPGGGPISPALLAAQLADLQALRALINHGADPNIIMTLNGTETETMTSPLLNGMFINSQVLPWEQRREMLDFLICHGADLNRSKKMVPLSLKIALQCREEPQAWLWALDHGKTVSTDEFYDMLEVPVALPLVERVLAAKMVNVNDNSGKQTPLQALTYSMRYAEVEHLDAGYEKMLDLLLAAGADPNLTTADTRRTPLQIMQSRTDFERSDGMPENSCCIEGPDIRTRWEMLCDKLRAAGAGNDSPTTTDEEDEDNEDTDDEEVYDEEDEDNEDTDDEEVYDEEEYEEEPESNDEEVEDSEDEIDEEDLETEEEEDSEAI